MPSINIRVFGITEVKTRMRRRHGNLKKMPHKKAAVILFRWIQKNFQAEGALHNTNFGPWKQLSPATIARRRKGRGVGRPKILQDTGNLRQRWDVRGNKLSGSVKSRQDYSGDHERGDPSRNLPQRKILPREGQAQSLVFPVFKDHVRISIRS